MLGANESLPQADPISKSLCENCSPGKAVNPAPSQSRQHSSWYFPPPPCASQSPTSAGRNATLTTMVYSLEEVTTRETAGLHCPFSVSPSQAQEGRGPESLRGTELRHSLFRLQNKGQRQAWKGGRASGGGGGSTWFLEARIQILLLPNPESPPSLPIDE